METCRLFPLLQETRQKLAAFEKAGGFVVHFADGMALPTEIDAVVSPDLHLSPSHPDLRFIHYRKDELDFYLIVNEGEEVIRGEVSIAVSGSLEVWDALSGTRGAITSRVADAGLTMEIALERRQSLVAVINPVGIHEPLALSEPDLRSRTLDVEWTVTNLDGAPITNNGEPRAFRGPGDWARVDGLELFSGSLSYHTTLDLPEADEVHLDLGIVGDIAELLIDGERVGVRMWAPYRLSLGSVTPGRHEIEVRITNSMSNEYDGRQMPSGLIGPVSLITT